MRLSIVVPVLDEADRLEALLAELARDCPGVEVVIADGGSRDGSVEIAARAPGVGLVSSARGRARQMNAGAALATGEVLLFLHADTRLPSGAAEAVQRALADPSVVYGRFDVRFDRPGAAFRLIARLMNLRSRLTGICTGDQAIFVRRAAFERLGGYPEIALMEDVELTRRLKRVGRLAALGLRVTTSARRWERERRGADDRPHVDAALPLPLRGRAGPPAPLVLRGAGGRRGEREGEDQLRWCFTARRRASRHRRHRLVPPRGSPGARPAPRAGARR